MKDPLSINEHERLGVSLSSTQEFTLVAHTSGKEGVVLRQDGFHNTVVGWPHNRDDWSVIHTRDEPDLPEHVVESAYWVWFDEHPE